MRDLRQRNIDLAVICDVAAMQDSDVLCTENLVWITAPNWVPPSDGVVPLALVRGPCAYRGAALAALEQNGMPWRCIVTCTSLQGVFAVVRAGLAVAVVTEGDIGSGVRAAPAGVFLPPLPGSSLTIRHADKQPTLAARALARTMADVLTNMTGGDCAEHLPDQRRGRRVGDEAVDGDQIDAAHFQHPMAGFTMSAPSTNR
ncbi:DNA-binding transcriptional LysR family regulator [Mycoplana sp. BE70]|uniref:LysR substrate-binding domain-containing protein n=1 Tax=Mycoplana sp. BE70 TaxID=2817775 RepID=UPI002861A096|nr:LysR substrate-binding domain-containing protein [Mycoplana sp. BE70]MDR6759378.1 DNA-binding transcriptional LysR family regulator [Mycoplana sp. BE70]